MKMNIDNFESLKEWLCRTLKPICDADPMALAKYVLALVKRDKSEQDLKSLCIDQLEVFLQKETLGFVDKLFEALTNKSYLLTPELPPTGARKVEFCPHPVKDVKKEEIIKEDEREKKFSRRGTRSPQQSSFRYRENRSRDRKKDDRSRKMDHDRNPPRRDSYRDRYYHRGGRSRSYSRSRSRSWSKERVQDRSRSKSRSWSRTRSKERVPVKPKYELERTGLLENSYTPVSSVSNTATDCYPVQTASSDVKVISQSHHGGSTTNNWTDIPEDQVDHSSYVGPPLSRKHCRDFNEKGFCMRGNMCPFDHGSNPLVVGDVNLPGMLPFPAQPPVKPLPGLPAMPPFLTAPSVNHRPLVPPPGPLPPSLPPSLQPITATQGFVDELFVTLIDKGYLPAVEKLHSWPSNVQSFQHPSKKILNEEMMSHGGMLHRKINNQPDESCFSNWNNRVAINALQSKVDNYECELNRLKRVLKASNDYIKDLETQVATLKSTVHEHNMCPASD